MLDGAIHPRREIVVVSDLQASTFADTAGAAAFVAERGDHVDVVEDGDVLKAEKALGTEEMMATLQENNKNYKVARSKALKDVKISMVSAERFYDYNEKQKKKGGQVKFPRVMKEEDFREWEEFASNKPEEETA